MKKNRGWITTTLIATVFALSATTVTAEIIAGNRPVDGVKPCTETHEKVDWGIIVTNITGIIVTNFTGIIVGKAADTPNVDCGIIVTN